MVSRVAGATTAEPTREGADARGATANAMRRARAAEDRERSAIRHGDGPDQLHMAGLFLFSGGSLGEAGGPWTVEDSDAVACSVSACVRGQTHSGV